ncbi:MAG: hypothetical protein ABIB65_05945 [Candidatus Margulisiibacteriota bacterium]
MFSLVTHGVVEEGNLFRFQEQRKVRSIYNNRRLDLPCLFSKGVTGVEDVRRRSLLLQMSVGKLQHNILDKYCGFPVVFRLFQPRITAAISKVLAFLYCVIEPTLHYDVERKEARINCSTFLRWRLDDNLFFGPVVGHSFEDFVAAHHLDHVQRLNGLRVEEKMPPGLMVDFNRRAEGLGTFLFAMAAFTSRRIFQAEDFRIMNRENSDILTQNICRRLGLACREGVIGLGEDAGNLDVVERGLNELGRARVEVKKLICNSPEF